MPKLQYLIAHACFDCRKSFKVAPRPDYVATCPSCGDAIHEMGRSFRAPPAKDREQWTKVQALFAAGFRFFSYRSTSGPPLPARLAEVEAFIRDNPAHPLRVAAPNNSFKPTPLRGAARHNSGVRPHRNSVKRLLTALGFLLLLVGCDQIRESCRAVEPGMSLAQVITVMGEPRDSFLLGDPPAGIMLVYGPETRDKWPQEANGPIAIEMQDAPSRDPADRTVVEAHCRAN